MVDESPTFRWVSEAIEGGTSLSLPQAGETLRLALHKAGLDAASVSRQEMLAVLRRVLPRELVFGGVDDAVTFCEELARGLLAADLPPEEARQETAEEVFRRLFGDD